MKHFCNFENFVEILVLLLLAVLEVVVVLADGEVSAFLVTGPFLFILVLDFLGLEVTEVLKLLSFIFIPSLNEPEKTVGTSKDLNIF